MRLINADEVKESISELKCSPWYANKVNLSWHLGIHEAVEIVEKLCVDSEPTVDAVPVIRCKYCKFNPEKTTLGCPMAGSIERNDNTFCSWAVIREEGDWQCN